MKRLIGLIAVVILWVAYSSMFVVHEGETALVLHFGRIVRTGDKPGLHFMLPFVQQAKKFDNRILSLEVTPERYLTSEKKSVIVDFYVKWQIADDAAYYQATAGDPDSAATLLTPIVKDALRDELKGHLLQDLVASGRKDVTGRVRAQTDAAARKSLGVTVVDVRIKRIDLPEEVSDSVYKRMRAERTQLANELRSTGQQMAETIKADADRQAQVIKAEAERDATEVRGDGDAQAARIYAQAYGQDPEFFAFYRSLRAYSASFEDGKGILVLRPDSEFFKYFSDGAVSAPRH